MDFGIIPGVNPSAESPGAHRTRLARQPRGGLTSTGFALANPGEEYLIIQPTESATSFNVRLKAGTYTVEWFSVNTRESKGAGKLTLKRAGNSKFNAPFADTGPAVLYLKRGTS